MEKDGSSELSLGESWYIVSINNGWHGRIILMATKTLKLV
jgi:hypothetical protein